MCSSAKGCGRGDTRAVDLDAYNAQVGVDMAQPAGGFQGGKRFGAIAQIDEQGVRKAPVGAAQHGRVVAGKEQVDAPQAILGSLAARDLALGFARRAAGMPTIEHVDIIPRIVSGLRVCFLHE